MRTNRKAVSVPLVDRKMDDGKRHVVHLVMGEEARELASDIAGEGIAYGAEIETVDLETGEQLRSQLFGGFGEGRWDEIREAGGRVTVQHPRRGGKKEILH